jgi:hypothetical protein
MPNLFQNYSEVSLPHSLQKTCNLASPSEFVNFLKEYRRQKHLNSVGEEFTTNTTAIHENN